IRDYKVTGVQTCALPIYQPDGERDDIHQPLVGLLHLRELAGPVDVIALGELGTILRVGDLLLGFVDGRGQVAALDAELDRDIPRSEERRVGKEGRCGWWA